MKTYGWGIVDKDGRPWFDDEWCVCEDRSVMIETAKRLNRDWVDEGALYPPFRAVRLMFAERKRK